MQISEITRRNVIDEIRLSGIVWHGRLGEVQFLSRLYDLSALPSNDGRFRTMAGDIDQHRVNNSDWPDDWVFEDSRLAILDGADEAFLRFLCEMVHPVVRTDDREVMELLKLFNNYLSDDGYEIYESKRVSNRPVFAARLITTPIVIASEGTITAEFVKDQLRKGDMKLAAGDLDGAITSARSLVEGVLGEIYQRCTGARLPSSGDLLTDYKQVKGLLNLSEDQHIHEGLRALIRSFNGIIQSIDSLSNKMGDRHRPVLKPDRHHAKLVLDSAKVLVDFLYSTMESQADKQASFVRSLLSILDSDIRFLKREELLAESSIAEVMRSGDVYVRRLAKTELLANYGIDSYRKSDIFYAAMSILIYELDEKDVAKMYVESQRNNQAIGWPGFKAELEKERPGLLGRAIEAVYDEAGR